MTPTETANTLPVTTNSDVPFEQIKQENNVDSMGEQSLPPDDLLPPIDSYSQDDFSEQNIDYPLDEDPITQIPFKREIPDSNSETDRQQEVTTIVLDSTLKEDKPSFFSEEQLEAPDIDIANYVADKLTDPWSLIIQKMDIKGLVKLLAKNCVMVHSQDNIILTLKAEQQHLLNNGKICEQLQNKLKSHFGEQVSMYIEVGEVEGQLTPIESEHVIYQQYLNNAKANIEGDPNIKSWVEDYDAKIYENTIIPL